MSFRTIIDCLNVSKKAAEKKQKIRQEKDRISGINIVSEPQIDNNKKIYFVLSNAVINYLVVVGMIGCFVKPFEIQCNMYIIMLAGILLSLYVAFLYYNIWIKVIGYLLGISGFVYGILRYQWVIRGGFAYIANLIMEYLEKDMDLPIERRYSTYDLNEKMAVTMCLLFLSFGLFLLFNMVISETKGVVLVLLFSFPITQFGMYFDEGLDIFYFTMYIIGITVLYFLRNTTHYHMEYRRRKGYETKEIKRKNKIVYDYVNDGKSTFCVLVMVALIVTAAVFSVSKIVEQDEFEMDSKYSELKDNTREFTRQFALVGFWGMFNKTGQSPGGVSNNKLGQVNRIHYDFQTDLVLKTVPVNGEEEIFIKCFNGSIYDNSYWETLSAHQGEVPAITDYNISVEDTFELSKQLMDYYGIGDYYKQIEITNVYANENYNYIPYFTKNITNVIDTVTTDDEFIGRLRTGWVFTAWYKPLVGYGTVSDLQNSVKEARARADEWCSQAEYESEEEKESAEIEREYLQTEEAYAEYVKDTYLQIPEYNLEAIRNFINRYSIDVNSDTVIEDVAAVFQFNFEYTLMPGKTPSEADFVNYFLNETQKGYCTYFATAATLIYRYMGIPARYAGGYKLSGDAFNDGVADENENPAEWADYDVGNRKVVRYELSDTNAHAWVEVYINGLGWIPVEVTPYSDYDYTQETEEENGGIGSYLANSVFTAANMNRVKNTTFSIIIFAIIGGVLFIILYYCAGVYIRKKRYNERKAEQRYLNLKKSMVAAGILSKEFLSSAANTAETDLYDKGFYDEKSYEESAEILVKHQFADDETSWNIMRIIEKEKFSKNRPTDEEIQYLIQNTNEINKKIYESLSWYEKFIYKYIKML